MVLPRDKHLAMAARRVNNLKVERLKRLNFTKTMAQRLNLLALLRDDSSDDFAKANASLRYRRFNY